MRSLIDICTNLCLAIVAKHVEPPVTLADAAAIAAGRIGKWTTWYRLDDADRNAIAQFLRLRPTELAQPSAFIREASKVFQDPFCAFEVVPGEEHPTTLNERHCFQVARPLCAKQLIDENLSALLNWRSSSLPAALPEHGDLVLTHLTKDQVQTFVVPAAYRSVLPKRTVGLHIPLASPIAQMQWSRSDLMNIAVELDGYAVTHTHHVESLNRLMGDKDNLQAAAGSFYRVNAPTGVGKTVVMVLMALDAVRQGRKVTLLVPNLTDVKNMVSTLTRSVAALNLKVSVTPLHSQRKVPQMAQVHHEEPDGPHPYNYSCLLNVLNTEKVPFVPSNEPCFNLRTPITRRDGRPSSRRIGHCPFLPVCGISRMLEQALEADIVVVNHHSLLAATTRVPFDDAEEYPGPRSFLEILLKRSSLFLVDEIDGLLQSAISSSVFHLELGNDQPNNPLGRFFRELNTRKPKVPDVSDQRMLDILWDVTYCVRVVNQFLLLSRDGFFEWPDRETVWSTSEDRFLIDQLKISEESLLALYTAEKIVPPALEQLRQNLTFWSLHDARRNPEQVASKLSDIISELTQPGYLLYGIKEGDKTRLKSALILKGVLSLVELHLRNLQTRLPPLVRAHVEYADEVLQALTGPVQLSPTPNGPLHRTVFGFKRNQSLNNETTLQSVSLRGDPHGTLLSLPDLTSRCYAGTPRVFIGLSATAYFPGASSFDLPAKDLIDVPDVKGHITFENVNVSVALSGAPINQRRERIRMLARELWPWLDARLASLRANKSTADRARLLLVTGSDADAEELATTLYGLPGGPGAGVALIRSRHQEGESVRLPAEQRMTYQDLFKFHKGPYAHCSILGCSIYPIARGHNIVDLKGVSALGGVVVCVRPMPMSDNPHNNLAHICYETLTTVKMSERPGKIMQEERRLANKILYSIRNAYPTFSQQPPNIRHYTIMNMLVNLTQLVGRGRRGGTPVKCYLADAAFVNGATPWATLLSTTISHMVSEGHWQPFARHHAGLAHAMQNYIERYPAESR
ncbi:DEAD/DEAH box helicase [Pseudomonas frederiksbergensis]|uniref:DEAD/DEAH-box helicase domain-containing protein n=1 Tax=Pseudomonas frederiksbergensis TaxID=104087 RepID=A0A423KGA0_9PSED|nr:DEAD/DEAH box helicase [Pseudomonas frederiksbergensis]RON51843.1 hypothetical protein BK665_18450 [Pseudomonas frederiksbergensis]